MGNFRVFMHTPARSHGHSGSEVTKIGFRSCREPSAEQSITTHRVFETDRPRIDIGDGGQVESVGEKEKKN